MFYNGETSNKVVDIKVVKPKEKGEFPLMLVLIISAGVVFAIMILIIIYLVFRGRNVEGKNVKGRKK